MVFAAGKDENYDLKKSTRKGRDYLRTKGYAGPGVAASLAILQVGTAPPSHSDQALTETVKHFQEDPSPGSYRQRFTCFHLSALVEMELDSLILYSMRDTVLAITFVSP